MDYTDADPLFHLLRPDQDISSHRQMQISAYFVSLHFMNYTSLGFASD